MKKHLFVIDKNLGLPIEDPLWQRFLLKFDVATSLYTDMQILTEEMKKRTAVISYLPAANYFFLRSDPFYQPIANALFASSQTSKINSVLIVSKKSQITTLAELKGKVYGYINLYCTSSYFSPALLLWRNHFSIHHFFGSLKPVGAWQLQIDAVISGKIDATMVQEDIWQKLLENKEQTKIIGRETGIPSPLIVCAKNIDTALLTELRELLFSYKPASPALFSGFIPFQKDQVDTFYSEAAQAFH